MASESQPIPSPPAEPTPKRAGTFSSIRSQSTLSGSVKQLAKDAMDADVPLGAWAAAAQTTAKAPTLGDIRQGSFSNKGWTSEGQQDANEGRMRRASSSSSGKIPKIRGLAGAGVPQVESVDERQERSRDDNSTEPFPAFTNDGTVEEREVPRPQNSLSPIHSRAEEEHATLIATRDQRVYSSGWQPPPKLPWTRSWAIGLKAFGRWAITPFGFLVTLYCLNVVAWGGMLFLLLCGAAPEMCWAPVGNGEYVRDCNHIDSPRRIWLEIDSQILNGLFCVTGFGLLPWRARDLYYLLKWRLCSEEKKGQASKLYGLRKLAGFYSGWVRLPGSDTLSTSSLADYNAKDGAKQATATATSTPTSMEADEANVSDPRLPLPLTKTPDAPLTGVRAPPTKLWKLDFYIWCNIWNTVFQTCLCGFMWGMNRYDRPSWSTGFFIACACVIAGAGGIVSFQEGKKIKRVEGVNPSPAVMAELEKLQHQKDGLELASTNDTERVSVHPNAKGTTGV